MFQRLGEAMTEKLVHIAVEDGKTKAACQIDKKSKKKKADQANQARQFTVFRSQIIKAIP